MAVEAAFLEEPETAAAGGNADLEAAEKQYNAELSKELRVSTCFLAFFETR